MPCFSHCAAWAWCSVASVISASIDSLVGRNQYKTLLKELKCLQKRLKPLSRDGQFKLHWVDNLVTNALSLFSCKGIEQIQHLQLERSKRTSWMEKRYELCNDLQAAVRAISMPNNAFDDHRCSDLLSLYLGTHPADDCFCERGIALRLALIKLHEVSNRLNALLTELKQPAVVHAPVEVRAPETRVESAKLRQSLFSQMQETVMRQSTQIANHVPLDSMVSVCEYSCGELAPIVIEQWDLGGYGCQG
jgi:hypothetical protein